MSAGACKRVYISCSLMEVALHLGRGSMMLLHSSDCCTLKVLKLPPPIRVGVK